MEQYPIESCCFATGHRQMPEGAKERIQARIRNACVALIACGVTHFYAGGANGFDMWFATVVLDLKRHYPDVTLTLLLPEGAYIKRLGIAEQAVERILIARADEAIFVGTSSNKPAPLVRNDALIERAKYGIAYLRHRTLTRRGGTAYTCRHAAEQGRRLIHLWEPSDEDDEMIKTGEYS